MELAIEEMKKSIAEPRTDKPTPKVGAVLVSPDGRVLASSFRGEMRSGDHAEFTILERKFRDKDVTGSYLFTTLEPCAPGARKHPKLGCAERIANARIAKVWVGIEDPDPKVDRKGIQYLIDCGIEVEMFDEDLQTPIFEENKEFLEQAKKRASESKKPREIQLTPLEQPIRDLTLSVLSDKALRHYISRSGLKMEPDSPEFLQYLALQELITYDENTKVYRPSGLGLLLFGIDPRARLTQAVVKVEIRRGTGEPEIRDFTDALVLLPDEIEGWLKRSLPSRISRKQFVRQTEYDYPIEVLREAILNAIAHRDYDITGAKISVNIDDDKIVVKSPGLPVHPILFEDFKELKAPSLSRNPKIMAVLNSMKYVEERGIGMTEMKSLPTKYGRPLPEIVWQAPYLSMTFPRTQRFLADQIGKEKIEQLTKEEQNGLFYIRDQKSVSKAEYAKHFGFNDKKAQRHLSKFKQLNLVKSVGKSTAIKYLFTNK